MTIFISYSNLDTPAVDDLNHDIGLSGQPTWLDSELGGGDEWWQKILGHIRGCAVFVFALSDNSIRSQPCRAELEYARALRVPVLPVQVGPVTSLVTSPMSDLQVIDYRHRSSAAGIQLLSAINAARANRRPLPEPLPEAPPVPFAYLLRLANTIAQPYLQSTTQAAVIGQLRHALRDEDDARVRSDVINLLQQLRRHGDCTFNHAHEIDAILSEAGSAPPPTPRRQRRIAPWRLLRSAATGPRSASTPVDPAHLRTHRRRALVVAAAVASLAVLGGGVVAMHSGSRVEPHTIAHLGGRPVWALATMTSSDGRQVILSAADDGTIREWDAATGAATGPTFQAAETDIRALLVVQRGDRGPALVAGGTDGHLRLWDAEKGGSPTDVGGMGTKIYTLAGGLDAGTVLWAGDSMSVPSGDSSQLGVVDAGDGHVKHRWRDAGVPFSAVLAPEAVVASGTTRQARCDPATPVVLLGNDLGYVEARGADLADEACFRSPHTHSGPVYAVTTVDLGAGRTAIATAGEDGVVDLYTPADRGYRSIARTPTSPVYSLATARVGDESMVISGSRDGVIEVRRAATGDLQGPPLQSGQGEIHALTTVVIDGQTVLVSAGSNGTVRTWNLTDPDPANA